MSIPRNILSRASTENLTSLADIFLLLEFPVSVMRPKRLLLGYCLLQHAHNVGLLHDQEILAVNLHLGAGPFAEQHAIALLEVDRNELAGLVAAARSDGNNLALRRLLLGAVRDEDAASGLGIGINALDNNTIV